MDLLLMFIATLVIAGNVTYAPWIFVDQFNEAAASLMFSAAAVEIYLRCACC